MIYMYLRDGIKEHFLKKVRKKFKKLNEINSDIQNMCIQKIREL